MRLPAPSGNSGSCLRRRNQNNDRYAADHLITGIDDGLLQGFHIGRAGNGDILGLQVDDSVSGSGDGLADLFHHGLAVGAHHAIDIDNSFHMDFLLDFGNCLGFRHFCLEAPQPQRIGHDKYRAEAHGRRAQHGAQQNAEGQEQGTGSNRDAKAIIEECPEKILPDIANGGLAEPHGVGDAG